MTTLNIATATSAELLAFFNANTGGAQVKKFADRPTAEKRVQKLIAEMETELLFTAKHGTTDFFKNAELSGDQCPGCGATQDITSGRVLDRFGKQEVIDNDYFTCHSCGHEWGTKDSHYVTVRNGVPVKARPAMVQSMKLDRRIVSVETGIVYANACQVWKAGVISSSQCDKLSRELYTAAKQGSRVVVTVNGITFRLMA